MLMSRFERAPLHRRIWSGEAAGWTRVAAAFLVPSEALFRLVVALRNRMYDNNLLPVRSSEIDVISVGNISTGGTGKTPVAAWLAARLSEAGRRPAIVHGGYGQDEPELHRRWQPAIPVVVGRDRIAAVREAAGAGADVAILDDGFQHRRLARVADIVLVAAETGLANVRLLPRGPFREPAASLGRASVVVVTRKSATLETAREVAADAERLVGVGRVAIVSIEPAGWRCGDGAATVPDGRVLAVAALAEPEPFAENAISAGARVSGTMWFRDHHEYSVDDARRILEASAGGPVVTTAKDAVKLSGLLPPTRYWVLEQRVVVESGGALLDGIVAGTAK
jgi:tetraacyldisaccharide 4'-kinase